MHCVLTRDGLVGGTVSCPDATSVLLLHLRSKSIGVPNNWPGRPTTYAVYAGRVHERRVGAPNQL